jgi:hypothetical protein
VLSGDRIVVQIVAMATDVLAMAERTLFDVATMMVDTALGRPTVGAVGRSGREVSGEPPTHLRAIGYRWADLIEDRDRVGETTVPFQHFFLTQ